MTTLTKAHLEIVRGASKEPSRYAINGMHVSPDGIVETTDGKMLIRLNGIPNPPKEGFIMHPASVATLNKTVQKTPKSAKKLATVEVNADKEGMTAIHESEGNKTTLTLDTVEGTFPKTKDVIPTDAKEVFRIDAKQLHTLLDIMLKANRAHGNNDIVPVEFSVRIPENDTAGRYPVLMDFEVPADTEYDGEKLNGQAVLMPLANRK